MKIQILALMALSAVAIVGCSESDNGTLVDRDGGGSDSAAVEAIAGDKSMVAQVLQRAHARGTFDDAMVEALKDSLMASEVAAIIQADPRFAAMFSSGAGTTAARTATSSSTKSTGGNTARSATSTTSKGDALDKAEQEAKKVNERLEQAARVKREAEQAKKTVDDIFGRR